MHAAFEALGKDDLAWRRAAAAARFMPEMRLPQPRDSAAVVAIVLATLVAIRALAKFPDAFLWAFVPQALVLCAMLAWAVHLVLAADDAPAAADLSC